MINARLCKQDPSSITMDFLWNGCALTHSAGAKDVTSMYDFLRRGRQLESVR